MQPERKYDRFDPVTVRAAARLVRYAQGERLSQQGVKAYLRELALLQPYVGRNAHRSLERVARRRASFGRLGVSTPFCQARVWLRTLPRMAEMERETSARECRRA